MKFKAGGLWNTLRPPMGPWQSPGGGGGGEAPESSQFLEFLKNIFWAIQAALDVL